MGEFKFEGRYEQLRDYQRDCVLSIFEAFNSGSHSTIAVLPMSAGKTYIVGAIIKRFVEKNRGKLAVMLSHLDILTRQNEESLRTNWTLNTGILQGGLIPPKSKECVVSTMQSFRVEEKINHWGMIDKLGLLVIDETHLYGSSSYDKIIQMIPKDCIVLGVTATPFRSNMDMTSMFDSTAFTISMQELIDRGMLVPPVLTGIKVGADEQFESIAKKVVTIYMNKHRGEKSIVFLRTIDQCNKLENMFKTAGINAKAITSRFTGEKRHECIDAFKANSANSADVLITVDVLTAGFSSDNVRSIFMPFNITSVSAYLQRIGRGMRLDDNKDHLDVYVGGETPELAKKQYEEMTKQALRAGSKDVEVPIDNINSGENGIIFDELTLELHNELRDKGMTGLADLVLKKDFPQELLDNLVEVKPVKSASLSKQKPTYEEAVFLSNNKIDHTKMTRLDAIYLISSMLQNRGYSKALLYSEKGRYENAPYITIPNMYLRSMIGKEGSQSFFTNRKKNLQLQTILSKI